MGLDTLITGVAHVGIRVRDLELSRTFYEGLGFRFIVGPVGPEPVAILVHPSGAILNLILNASSADPKNVLMDLPEKYPGYTHMALSVSELDAVQTELDTLGVRITEGPIDFGLGARGLFVRDPDGNVIELNETRTSSTGSSTSRG
jgi:lactoylglutathione lyase